MRILYVTPGYKPAYRLGGPIVSVSAAAEWLVRKGHEVTVVTTNANLDEDLDVPCNCPVDIEGVEVWYLRRQEPLKKWLPFVPYLSHSMGYTYAPEMRTTLDRLMPFHDVVDTQAPFVYPTLAAAHAAQRHRTPLFYHQRGDYLNPHRLRRRLKKAVYISLFEKPIMRHATALIALTAAEREAFAVVAPQTRCEIVPNGVEVPPLDRAAAARVEARYAIPREAPVILFLGRLHPWKGVDELMGAFALVQREFPAAYLIMAGPDECDAVRRWQPVAARAGFAARLIFPGIVTGSAKVDLLQRANLFSLPSQGEGLSMAMLEALAHATAVLLSPGCNFAEAEQVGAGVTAAKHPDALACALRALLRDPIRLDEMGQAGRCLVRREYSWDVVTERLLEVYNQR